MSERLSQQDKWKLIRDLSTEQAEMLADQIWKGIMKDKPTNEKPYKDFMKSVMNNVLSITDRFDEFNKVGKFIEALPKSEFTKAEVDNYKEILILKTATNIVGSVFYMV